MVTIGEQCIVVNDRDTHRCGSTEIDGQARGKRTEETADGIIRLPLCVDGHATRAAKVPVGREAPSLVNRQFGEDSIDECNSRKYHVDKRVPVTSLSLPWLIESHLLLLFESCSGRWRSVCDRQEATTSSSCEERATSKGAGSSWSVEREGHSKSSQEEGSAACQRIYVQASLYRWSSTAPFSHACQVGLVRGFVPNDREGPRERWWWSCSWLS